MERSSPDSAHRRQAAKPAGQASADHVERSADAEMAMARLFPRLRSRLLLLVCLVLLPFCALLIELGNHYYQFAAKSVYQNVGSQSRFLVAAQNEKIEEARQLMTMVAAMPGIQGGRGNRCGTLDDIRKRFALRYVNLGLADVRGRLLCDGAAGEKQPGFDGRKWFRQSLELRQFSIGSYEIDAASGKAVAVAVAPVLDDDGRVQGAVFAMLDLAWITRFNTLAALPERSIVLMFDHDGLILRRDPEPQRWVGKRHHDAPFLRSIMAGGASGVLEMPALDGIRRLVAFETLPSQNGNVYLVVGVPSDVAFAALHREYMAIGVIVVLVIILTLALTWVTADRLIVSRVDQLAAAARRFGEGEHGIRSGLDYSTDEIGELARMFDGMAEAIKRRGKQLQQYYYALDQHAIVSTSDRSGNIIFINDKFCEISGYRRDELIGKNHRVLNSGYHSAEFFGEMWKTISGGQTWQGVIRNQRKDGSFYWVVSTIVPQLDEHGFPAHYLSIRTDITASLWIKEALERSEEKFRLLAENSLDVVSLHELDGRFIYISPSFSTVFGYNHAEMIGAEPWSLVHPNDLTMVRNNLHQPILDGEKRASAIFRMLRSSGEIIWVETITTPVFSLEGKVVRIQATLRDITQRKEAEDNLRLHDKAIQSSPSGIVLFSNEKNYPVTYVNPAFEAITGYQKGESIGHNMPFQLRHAGDDNGIHRIRAAIRDRREERTLLRVARRDGVLRWLDCSVAPVRNENQEVTHFVAAFSDMTERMTMVEELLHAKEVSEQASQAKSDFLSRMTHELRTPLNFILGFAQLLETKPENLSEPQKDGVRRIIKSGWHLRGLIDEVLDLARIESGMMEVRLEDVRLDALIDECMGVVALTAGERGIRLLSGTIPQGAERLRADRIRIRQVLLNLLSNAVKFNREGGIVSIGQEITARGRVRITVSDTGPGIDGSRLVELFQPFNRLGADKSEIPGTGIGLAISQRFMHLMEGEIGVSSVLGVGSSFWVELPLGRDYADYRNCSASSDTASA